MYQILVRVNRYVSFALAAILLVSFALPPLQTFLGLDTVQGLVIISALLAGCVLADRRLARLSFEEVSEEIKDVSLEDATAKFWEEKKRKDREKTDQP